MTILPKDFKKIFSVTRRTDKHGIHFLTEKIVSYEFGNVTVYVTSHGTGSCNRIFQVGSPKKEETETKIILHVYDCFKNSHIIIVKTGDTDKVTLFTAHG